MALAKGVQWREIAPVKTAFSFDFFPFSPARGAAAAIGLAAAAQQWRGGMERPLLVWEFLIGRGILCSVMMILSERCICCVVQFSV